MGKVSNNHIFLLPLLLPADTDTTKCPEKEETEPDQAVMEAEQIEQNTIEPPMLRQKEHLSVKLEMLSCGLKVSMYLINSTSAQCVS